jgi:hypothetical protein
VEGLTTRSEYTQLWADAQEGFDELGTRLDQMLAIVQHEEKVLGLKGIDERVPNRAAGLLGDLKRTGDGPGYMGGIRYGSQLHQPDAIAVLRQHGAGHRLGQTGLARTTGSGQRDQAGRAQQSLHLHLLTRSPNEAAQGKG